MEGQTIQWPKEKGQMDNDLQNIAQKHKDRATRTPLKTGGELRYSTCGTHRVTPCCKPVMNVENSSRFIKTTLQLSHSNFIS